MITHVVDAGDWDAETIEIVGDAYRHLFRARRLAKDETIRLASGDGRACWARILEIDRRSARLAPGEPAPANEPDRRLTLIVGTPKNERASWLVEKATEVGVHAIRFISCERSPRRFGDGALARLRRMAVAAVEQCHRARVPEISGVHDWDELPDLVEASPVRWMLDTTLEDAEFAASIEPAVVLIGPEGGWSDSERASLQNLDARAVSLGRRILRVETAAVAAASKLLLFP